MAVTGFLLIFLCFTLYFRFYLPFTINKIVFSLAILLFIEGFALLFEVHPSAWMYLAFIAAAAYSFSYAGCIAGSLLAFLLLQFHTGGPVWLEGVLFLGAGAVLSCGLSIVRNEKQNKQKWIDMLMDQSKNLHVFRETSLAMQQTFDRDRLLHIILTSVTAGHGLGFNRAMIFLLSPEGTSLKGGVGIGPMSVDEGFKIWEKISANRLGLEDLIENDFTKEDKDPHLNAILKSLEIPLNGNTVLRNAVHTQQAEIIARINEKDDAQVLLQSLFDMKEFAIVPLVNQGKTLGLLLLDNLVNKRPISIPAIENVIPLASQAAIALDHARLYAQIQELAMKDGLTGLHNQRALQEDLALECKQAASLNKALSLLLLDLDFFKKFNDQQGHLLGNEALKKLAGILKAAAEGKGRAYRFGGEEFVIVLPGIPMEGALKLAEGIRRTVEETYFEGEETQPGGCLTISIGAACGPLAPADLTDDADRALYIAKRLGKNRVYAGKDL